jgi:hypothetical protein
MPSFPEHWHPRRSIWLKGPVRGAGANKEPTGREIPSGTLKGHREFPGEGLSRKILVKRSKRLIIAALPRERLMEPLDPLGPALRHAGHEYELWLRRNEWHLYRGEPNGTSFRFFIIIRADGLPGPDKSGDCYGLRRSVENVNLCGPIFCNVSVARDKFFKLVKGETRSMTYRRQNRNQYQDRRVRVDLPALQRLNLDDVFRVLEGR